MSNIRVAGIVNDSITDGVGLRMVIFTQGCPHKCAGCHNPQTHSFDGGVEMSSQQIIDEIASTSIITGVTLSGGEPMCQAKALLPVAEYVKSRGLHLCVYSGYTYDRLLTMGDDVQRLLDYVDVLVDGPFVLSEKSLNLKFMGSKNQRPIDIKKTREAGAITLAEGWY